jgi:L-threonylcarbamoyladenylate synthase
VILRPTPPNLRRAVRVLLSGGVVAFPTETVYGLGADALDPSAVEKIFKTKHRPHYDPLIIHIADRAQLDKLVSLDDRQRALVDRVVRRFWPGPLTLVLPRSRIVPDIVTSGLRTVAVRMPAHPLALKLIRIAGVPVAAPSANRFGRLSPVTARHVEEQLGRTITVLDGGRTSVGVESTILDLSSRNPSVLRPGGIPAEKIAKFLNREIRVRKQRKGTAPKAPGQLPTHYAPRTPLVLLGQDQFRRLAASTAEDSRDGFLWWKKSGSFNYGRRNRCLSRTGDAAEASRNLYLVLHEMDEEGFARIIAERPPSKGLGSAVLDRLSRAGRKK